LVSDPALLERLGKAGRELVRKRFRDDQMVQATQQVYRDLLKVT
jgi:glycosyltransferase involved in cell wall biosynthesis